MLSLMSYGAVTDACLSLIRVSLAQYCGPDKMYVMLLQRVQEAAEVGLSVSPSVPALLLRCGAGWGGREEVVPGALFPFDCRTASKSVLFLVSCLQARTGPEHRCWSSIWSSRAIILFPAAFVAGCAVGRGCAAGAGGRAAASGLPASQAHGGDSAGCGTSEAGLGESS